MRGRQSYDRDILRPDPNIFFWKFAWPREGWINLIQPEQPKYSFLCEGSERRDSFFIIQKFCQGHVYGWYYEKLSNPNSSYPNTPIPTCWMKELVEPNLTVFCFVISFQISFLHLLRFQAPPGPGGCRVGSKLHQNLSWTGGVVCGKLHEDPCRGLDFHWPFKYHQMYIQTSVCPFLSM